MSEKLEVNRVRSYSSGTPGRCLNNVGTHHFVIDEPAYAEGPEEEITPVDSFLASISACAVLMIEGLARRRDVPLQRMDVSIEGVRNSSDLSVFQSVSMRFEVVGPSQTQVDELIERFKKR